MYEAAFKNIDNTLREDDGCGTELDYIEQTSWVLFLKYLDDFESEKETAALLNCESYTRIIDGEFGVISGQHPRSQMAAWTTTSLSLAMTCATS